MDPTHKRVVGIQGRMRYEHPATNGLLCRFIDGAWRGLDLDILVNLLAFVGHDLGHFRRRNLDNGKREGRSAFLLTL